MRAFMTVLMAAGVSMAAAAGTLTIKGSNTFGEELGPRLIADFQRYQPGLEVVLESKGTASGVLALLEGTCDIAAASRPLTEDEERLMRSRRMNLRLYTIGFYGVAVVTHPDLPLRGLSDREVRDIFTGVITSWKAVDGPEAPIQVYIRDSSSGTHLGFQEVAMERRPYAASARVCASDAAMAEALRQDPHGIGYVGMTRAAPLGLKALAINGIPPSVLAVSDALYPYARQLRLYTNKNAEPADAITFIKFVRSTQGQNVLDEMGFVRRFHRKLTFGSEVP